MRVLNPLPIIKERVVTKEVVRVEWRDRVVNKDVVVTKVITKPDGTKVVVESKDKSTTTDKSGSTTTTEEKQVERIQPWAVPLARYSVSVGMPALPFPSYTDIRQYQVEGAIRLGDLPLWLTIGGQPLQKEVYLGLRVEF